MGTRVAGFVRTGFSGRVVAPGNRVCAPLLLRSQEDVRFRYQLEDFDHDWIDAGSSRIASYTNLPPGSIDSAWPRLK